MGFQQWQQEAETSVTPRNGSWHARLPSRLRSSLFLPSSPFSLDSPLTPRSSFEGENAVSRSYLGRNHLRDTWTFKAGDGTQLNHLNTTEGAFFTLQWRKTHIFQLKISFERRCFLNKTCVYGYVLISISNQFCTRFSILFLQTSIFCNDIIDDFLIILD